MAKSRKKARRSGTKRTTKKRTIRTAKLKGRKVAKPRRAKPRSAKAKRKGLLAGAMDAVREATGMRRRMDRNTFEGQ